MDLNLSCPIEFRGVSKSFGSTRAVDDVSFTVDAGGVVGLLGPNGSGKTTLLSMLSGLRAPTVGAVKLFGADPRDPRARVRLGVTPQHAGVVKSMRVRRMVEFAAAHYTYHMDTDDLLGGFRIDHLAGKRIGGLSGGQQRLLSAALAFVGRPRLVLLDEPSTGLDITARDHLWEAIRSHAMAGTTVLLTSHYLEEMQALADRIVMVRAGRVIADDTTRGLLSRNSGTFLRVRTQDDRALTVPGVERAWREGSIAVLEVADASAGIKALALAGVDYTDIDIDKPSLEDAFRHLADRKERS